MKVERKRLTTVRVDGAEGYRESAVPREHNVRIHYSVLLSADEVREALLSYIEDRSDLNALAEGSAARLVVATAQISVYPNSVPLRVEWESDEDEDEDEDRG